MWFRGGSPVVWTWVWSVWTGRCGHTMINNSHDFAMLSAPVHTFFLKRRKRVGGGFGK